MNLVTRIATHLAKQRSRSMGEIGCAYRGSLGKMCAVGCVIPDELYSPAMEGHGLSTLPERHPEVIDHLLAEHGSECNGDRMLLVGVLDVAQEYHDQGDYISAVSVNRRPSDEEFAIVIEDELRNKLKEAGIEWA